MQPVETVTYADLRKQREALRPTVVAEPKWRQGVFWPTLTYRTGESAEKMLEKGVMSWTRIAMATVLTGGEAMGWDKFFNTLDKEQRPSSERKAKRLMKEFNIEGDSAADAVNLMVTWAKGDLFSWHKHPYVTEHELMGFGSWCPQVQAVEEMGMGNRADKMKLWCDFYDSTISQSVNKDIRMVHAHCPSAGNKYCMFYIFEEKDPANTKNCADVLNFFNDRKRVEVDKNPNPDYFEGMAAPRNIEGWSEAAKLKDGVQTKARIALETLVISGVTLGWEPYLNQVAKEQSWGYREEAIKLKRDYSINGDTLRDAGNLLAIGYGLLGFDHHSIIKYTPDVVEGVSDSCQIIDAAREVGMLDKIKDVSLWCDFYHNHKVHAVNEAFQVTHTHCIGCGDKFCRFILKKKEPLS
jgi:hypothetical protein